MGCIHLKNKLKNAQHIDIATFIYYFMNLLYRLMATHQSTVKVLSFHVNISHVKTLQ